MISFIEIFIDGFYVFCSTSCCVLPLTPFWMGHLRVRSVSLGVFRWRPLEYPLLFTWWCIIRTRWVWMDKKKKSKFDAISFCLQVFLFVCLHSSPKFVKEKKKPYVFIILLHSFCQLTQTITMYQIKITNFDADLSFTVRGRGLNSGLQFPLEPRGGTISLQ